MTGSQWSDEGYAAIARLLGARAGLEFRPNQRDSIEQGIRHAMKNEGIADLHDYVQCLHREADMLDNLLTQTTVGETYFFRDPTQFQIIGEQILPAICDQHDPSHVLRFWSAGCASGEEAYSLAMLLRHRGLLSRASVLGTDISREAINQARLATYRQWSLRGPGKDLATPYLNAVDSLYQVNPTIREAVHFEYLNLALDNYPSTVTGTRGLHLILCRNVMIYFDQMTIRSIAQRFLNCLLPGGWLVTAVSDPPIHELGLFEPVTTDHGLVYRKPLPFEQRAATWLANHADQAEPELRALSSSTDDPPALPNSPPAEREESPAADHDAQISDAVAAITRGDYELAARITAPFGHIAKAACLRVKALANRDVGRAEAACAEATKQHPLSTELHYLHAILLIDLNQHIGAADALQRVLFLDRSLALAHFSLGTVHRTLGKFQEAKRAFGVARDLCQARGEDEPLPLGEGQCAGDVLEMIKLQMAAIEQTTGAQS